MKIFICCCVVSLNLILPLHTVSGQTNECECAYSPMYHLGGGNYLYWGQKFVCDAQNPHCSQVEPITVTIPCNINDCGYGEQWCGDEPPPGADPHSCFPLNPSAFKCEDISSIDLEWKSVQDPTDGDVLSSIVRKLADGTRWRKNLKETHQDYLKIKAPNSDRRYFVRISSMVHKYQQRAIIQCGIEVTNPPSIPDKDTPVRLAYTLCTENGLIKPVLIRGVVILRDADTGQEFVVRVGNEAYTAFKTAWGEFNGFLFADASYPSSGSKESTEQIRPTPDSEFTPLSRDVEWIKKKLSRVRNRAARYERILEKLKTGHK